MILVLFSNSWGCFLWKTRNHSSTTVKSHYHYYLVIHLHLLFAFLWSIHKRMYISLGGAPLTSIAVEESYIYSSVWRCCFGEQDSIFDLHVFVYVCCEQDGQNMIKGIKQMLFIIQALFNGVHTINKENWWNVLLSFCQTLKLMNPCPQSHLEL